MSDKNKPVTKNEVKKILDIAFANEREITRKELNVGLGKAESKLRQEMREGFNEMAGYFNELAKKQDQQFEDMKRYMGVLNEEAEEPFLKTSHDVISVHGNRLDNHNERITRLETIGA